MLIFHNRKLKKLNFTAMYYIVRIKPIRLHLRKNLYTYNYYKLNICTKYIYNYYKHINTGNIFYYINILLVHEFLIFYNAYILTTPLNARHTNNKYLILFYINNFYGINNGILIQKLKYFYYIMAKSINYFIQ